MEQYAQKDGNEDRKDHVAKHRVDARINTTNFPIQSSACGANFFVQIPHTVR